MWREVVNNLAEDSDEITVFWGAEKFSPIQYNTIEIGPFIYKTKPRPGETVEDAFKRAHDFLESIASRAFEVKKRGFKRRYREITE